MFTMAYGNGIHVQQSKAMTKAMQHACIAIQSAHHHYRQAMDLVDAVCSPKKNRWEAVMGDEQSRQETYRGESSPHHPPLGRTRAPFSRGSRH